MSMRVGIAGAIVSECLNFPNVFNVKTETAPAVRAVATPMFSRSIPTIPVLFTVFDSNGLAAESE